MEPYGLLRIIACLLSLCHCQHVEVPDSVTAVEGSCVLVPCNMTAGDTVTWYKYKSVGYPKIYDARDDVMPEFKGRTSLLRSAKHGNCSLVIDRVRRDDNGLFIYVGISSEDGSTKLFYDKTTKINFVHRQKPSLSLPESQVDGASFTASCSVRHSCPMSPPSFEWEGISQPYTFIDTLAGEGGLWVSMARITATVTHQNRSGKVRCTTRFSEGFISSEPHQLNVLYAPLNVSVSKRPPVHEGENVALACLHDSNPKPHRFQWFITHDETNEDKRTDGSIIIYNVRRKTVVSCLAQNKVGEGRSDAVFLDVHFAPDIQSDSECLKEGETWRCQCRVEARPHATVDWLVSGGSDRQASFSRNIMYSVNVATAELRGALGEDPNVSCVATNSLGMATQHLPCLRGQDISDLVWRLIAGLGSGVFLLGAALFGCWKCQKKRTKLSPDIPLKQKSNGRRNKEESSMGKDHQFGDYENWDGPDAIPY